MSENQAMDDLSSSVRHCADLTTQIRREIEKKLIGQTYVVDQVLTSLIAGGHILVEGVPGLGKTLLVKTLSDVLGGRFSRIQFTPDLMPADVTGHSMFNMKSQEFEIREGPVFTNYLLADEINRAPAKTQAALLEVMQESQVTIEGKSMALERPFMVMATQNPIEQDGTYPLPEAELDRFMMKVYIDYPNNDDELRMVDQILNAGESDSTLAKIISSEDLLGMQQLVRKIRIDEKVLAYGVNLVRSTREWHGIARGAGPRGSLALLACAKACALMSGSPFVTPDHIKTVASPVLRHRLLLSADLEIEGVKADQVLGEMLDQIEAPRH